MSKRSELDRARAAARVPTRRDDRPPGREPVRAPTRWLGAALLFVVVTGAVAMTANDLGVTWDEPPYRYSQIGMARWFRALAGAQSIEQAKALLTKEAILKAWEYNRFGPNFHPPMAGMLCNLTHATLEPMLGDLPARRMASGVELALAASLLFLFLSRRYGLWVAGVAGLSLILMPRVFGHAHIAGTDMPLLAFWSFVALSFWKGLESAVWRVGFGFLFGLSLLVKFTALLAVVPLGVWLLCYRIVPRWSNGRAAAAVIATVLVGWPLAVAGVEIVRLAHRIQLATQQDRMLGPAIEGMGRELLGQSMPNEPPFTADHLRAAAEAIERSSPDSSSFPIHALLHHKLAEAARSHGAGSQVDWNSVASLLQAVRERVFQDHFGHGPPYSEVELHRMALEVLGEVSLKNGVSLEERIGHAAPYSVSELKHAAAGLNVARLALDQYVGYVEPRDLGASTVIAGWILFVPFFMWLLWNAICFVPFIPAAVRCADGGLGLWLAGLGIAPAVAIGFNPTWWHETLPQLAHYYQISVGRQGSLPDIEIFYLGQKFFYSLPWHNGWLLMAVTVPLPILACSVAGVWSAIWHWRSDPLRMFFLLNMMTLPVSRMLPTPAHDGVRLMLPVFFFLAGLAGWGFEWIERFVNRVRSEAYSPAPVLAVAAGLILGPPVYWLTQSHPYELSYYNGLAGGLKGAQQAGFEPTYWYDAVTPRVLADLNDPVRGLPPSAVLSLPEPQSILLASLPPGPQRDRLLHLFPERRINTEVFVELWLTRKLRQDIRIPDIRGVAPELDQFPYVALLTHSSKASPFTRLLYGFKPRDEWGHDGVRLFSLYDPHTVARAWALWLLVDASDYTKPRVKPRVDRAMVELAGRDYRSLYAAALRTTEVGLDKAAEADEDPESLQVVRKLASRRELLDLLLARHKDALIEAVEILSRVAEKRPELLELLVEGYDGYLPASQLGSYLDAFGARLPGE